MSSHWSATELKPLFHWIAGRTGLVLDEQRRDAAVAAVENLAKRTSLSDLRALRRRLEADSGTLDDFLAELTVGETYFLRDTVQMEVIREEVLPDVAAHRGERGLRLWSAGCSTGEEPYSLAILLKESGLDAGAEVLGTDLSRARLAVARRGRYRAWSFRGVPEKVRERYFRAVGKDWELSPSLRAAVDFRYLNLVEDRFPSLSTGVWGMDLILCRNVLIYLDPTSVRRVVRKLFDSLAEGGWLLLGASDPLVANEIPAEVVVTAAGLAYRRSGGYARSAPRPALAPPSAAEPPSFEPPAPEPPSAPPAQEPEPAPQPVEVPAAEVAGEPTELEVLYARREYERVVAGARAAIAEGRDAERVRVLLVRALANEGRLGEAGVACTAAREEFRISPELLYLHALLLQQSGHAAEAAQAARQVLYLDRSLVVAQLLLGDALARLGRSEAAARALRGALRSLQALADDTVVPASDGERAGRLRKMAEIRIRLLEEPAV